MTNMMNVLYSDIISSRYLDKEDKTKKNNKLTYDVGFSKVGLGYLAIMNTLLETDYEFELLSTNLAKNIKGVLDYSLKELSNLLNELDLILLIIPCSIYYDNLDDSLKSAKIILETLSKNKDIYQTANELISIIFKIRSLKNKKEIIELLISEYNLSFDLESIRENEEFEINKDNVLRLACKCFLEETSLNAINERANSLGENGYIVAALASIFVEIPLHLQLRYDEIVLKRLKKKELVKINNDFDYKFFSTFRNENIINIIGDEKLRNIVLLSQNKEILENYQLNEQIYQDGNYYKLLIPPKTGYTKYDEILGYRLYYKDKPLLSQLIKKTEEQRHRSRVIQYDIDDDFLNITYKKEFIKNILCFRTIENEVISQTLFKSLIRLFIVKGLQRKPMKAVGKDVDLFYGLDIKVYYIINKLITENKLTENLDRTISDILIT